MAYPEKITIEGTYGEQVVSEVDGKEIVKVYKSSFSFDLVLEDDEERKAWSTSQKIDAMRSWISSTLRASIHREMVEKGDRTGKESDFEREDEE